jgi:hypothetical protein
MKQINYYTGEENLEFIKYIGELTSNNSSWFYLINKNLF